MSQSATGAAIFGSCYNAGMSEASERPVQVGLWDFFFWLTLGSVFVAAATGSLRGSPMSPVWGGLGVGVLVHLYRRRRDRTRSAGADRDCEAAF